jgi:hypothetical protein
MNVTERSEELRTEFLAVCRHLELFRTQNGFEGRIDDRGRILVLEVEGSVGTEITAPMRILALEIVLLGGTMVELKDGAFGFCSGR